MPLMKAVQVSHAGGAFELVERPVPEPQNGQVRIKVQACGVCQGDNAVKIGGHFPVAYPRIPGHEVVGVIDAIGQGVHAWSIGQRVGIGWFGGHDFTCQACRRGDFQNCANAQVTGISFDGGYAEYMVAPQEGLVRVPDGLTAVEAAPLLCAGLTTFNALRNSGARAGDLVAVQGVGGLGHLGIQFASRAGFRTVALSRGKDKERLARELGADDYIDTETSDPAQALLRMGGARLILATAPGSKAITSALGGLQIHGQLLVVAAPEGASEIYLAALIPGARSIQGWASGIATDSEDTLNFSILRHIRPLTETFPLERVEEAYQRMMTSRVRFRAVLVP